MPEGSSEAPTPNAAAVAELANALSDLNAPTPLISPLVQQLPKLWELYHNFGITTLELNPIRMRPERGRLIPVACDFKCGFDRDDARWQRLGLPPHIFAVDYSDFEQEINQLRTYQGQSDVYVINAAGTILAPTGRVSMQMVKAFGRTLSQKRNQKGDESIEEPRLDLFEKNEVKAKRPRMWNIVFYNDDSTPMDFVESRAGVTTGRDSDPP